MYYQIYKFINNIKKYGVIDKDGSVIIDTLYEGLTLTDNYIVIKKNNNYGVLNLDGDEIVECKYDSISEIHSGFLVEKDGFYGILSSIGSVIIDICYNEIEEIVEDSSFIVSLDSKIGVIKSGKFIVEMQYEYIRHRESGTYSIGINDEYGLINVDKNIYIEPKFDSVSDFDSTGYSIASLNGKNGFINIKGEWLVQPQFDSLKPYDSNNISIVSIGLLNGLIDRNGKWIIQPAFDDCQYFKKNYLVEKDKKKYLIDKNGEWIKDMTSFDLIQDYDKNGLALYSENYLYGLIHKKNKIAVEAKYEFIVPLVKEYYCVYEHGKLGVININGEIILDSKYECHSWYRVNNEKIILQSEGKYFTFDCNKKKLIELPCKPMHLFHDNGIAVAKNQINKYGVIDTEGHWIISPIYDRLEEQDVNGCFKAFSGNIYGWLGIDGNWSIQPIFEIFRYTKNEELTNESIDFESDLYYSILHGINTVFPKDDNSIYIEDEIPKTINLNLDLDFVFGLKHLVFIDDSIDKSFSSGILISFKNDNVYMILIEKWSKPVVIWLNTFHELEKLKSINYNNDKCLLYTYFDKTYELKDEKMKLYLSQESIDLGFKLDSIYYFNFYNKQAINYIVEFVELI